MPTVAELMRANLFDVFNERDPDRRAAAVAATYSQNVLFYDPDGMVAGHEALDEKAKRLLEASPLFVFSAIGPVLESSNLGYLEWALGPAGEDPVARGIDMALVDDGLISVLHTIIR